MNPTKNLWPDNLTVKPNGKTLVLGMGGGYDIYTCLPWFLTLSKIDQDNCILANYTFTDDIHLYTTEESPYVAEITSETIPTEKNHDYFPERHLAKCLNRTIYTVRLMPCPLLIDIIESMIKTHSINQIILFDGGIDSVIFGDEGSCHGSPLDDSQTLMASVIISNKYDLPCTLVASAYGIDDCNMATYQAHWADLTDLGATHGTCKITNELPNWETYKTIVQSSDPASIIQECIISAAEGKLGLYLNPRLYPIRIDDPKDFPLLRPETNLFWLFDAKKLAAESPFYQHLMGFLDQTTVGEMNWVFWNQTINLFMYRDQTD